MADSRKLDDLHPRVRKMAERLLADAAAAGIPLTVTFTLRSMATQAALYAQGRTKPGKIVTNAPAGYSFHNFGLALDVVPTALLKLPSWGDTPSHQKATDALWARVGAIGKAIGFRWGGDFKSIKDRPHFEWSGDLVLADLRAGKRPAEALA
jgi:peptidoglycan L-alanyl-D-glutamate endopeptidase CwlK